MIDMITKKWRKWFDQSWETSEAQRVKIENLEDRLEKALESAQIREIGLEMKIESLTNKAKARELRIENLKSLNKTLRSKKEPVTLSSGPVRKGIRRVARSEALIKKNSLAEAKKKRMKADEKIFRAMPSILKTQAEMVERRKEFNMRLPQLMGTIDMDADIEQSKEDYIQLLQYMRIHQIENKKIIITDIYNDTERSFAIEDKRKMLDKQDDRCKICNTHLEWSNSRADHEIPHSLGGSTDASNIRILCRDHDNIKANSLIDDENLLKLGKLIESLRLRDEMLLNENLAIAE